MRHRELREQSWVGEPGDARADAYQRAVRRVRKLRGFYLHAMVYATVMTMLIVINLLSSSGRFWFPFPLLGWGLGLAIHGLAVWQGGRWLGAEWEARKIAEILSREQIRTLSTEKQLAEARLRLLQAQIEPHFLFNTLANVLSLIDTAPAAASRMLEHFIAYLRKSLTASRAERGTVGQEASLLTDYLALLAIRMGDRLQSSITIEPGLADVPMAPMLVQPVVENAIRHGLEPRLEGGRVDVQVRRLLSHGGARMVIQVVDDGLGFKPGSSAGVGLDNLRERLTVLYDGRAQLSIESPVQASGRGTAVRIDLPLDADPLAAGAAGGRVAG